MECKVCGREKEELEGEFGIDIEMKEHQGMTKCSKCIQEYERELGHDEKTVSDKPEDMSGGDWKNKITA